jgi:RNA polymerase sigma factor (sigma-70 family)
VEAASAPRPHALRIPRPRKYLAALSDERLVEHVRRGEPAAFEALYDRHSGGILGFCRHMLGNTADAEDAVQHTFIAAHSDIVRHDQRDLHVKAWLYTIARNRCLSMLRARREQATGARVEVATDNLLHDVQHRDDIRALLGDIAKLPDEQREALVLAEVGDLSHSDISDILGCEVSKVKSLVFQARTALIDRRTARDTPCAEIREQLATLRGGALRRSHLRHHLEACPGCTEYREEIRRQRAMLAVALPVLPTVALKANVFSGLGLGGGTAAASAGAGGVAATATSGGLGLAGSGGIAAKLGLVAILAVGGAGGATIAKSGNLPLVHDSSAATEQGSQSHNATAATSAAHTSTTGESASGLTAAQQKTREHKTNGSRRSASGTEHGFTPVTGESNGARAREFAKTRGKGEETSAAHRHVTAHKRARPAKPVKVQHVTTQPKAPTTRTAPTHTQPTTAPKSTTTQPTATQPTPTTTTPTTTTESAAPPSGGDKGKSGTAGKSLQTGASIG